MADKAVASGNGIGFSSLLGLLFIAFKLAGIINWSWLWVLAPFWIPFAFGLVMFGIFAVVVLVLKMFLE